MLFTLKQNFSILRHLVGELSYFEFEAYRVTLPGASDLKLFVVGVPLWWRQSGRDSVSNHQPHDCLLNRLFGRRSKLTSTLRVTGLCVGNSPHKWPVTRKMSPFDDVIMHTHTQTSTNSNFHWKQQQRSRGPLLRTWFNFIPIMDN